MSIVLTRPPAGGQPAHGITLPADLVWVDELTWAQVAQSQARGISGSLIVEAMARTGGRTITLAGEGNSAWIRRGTLRQLHQWAAVPGLVLHLNLRGEAFNVLFDHGDQEDGRAFAMQALIEYSDKNDSDWYCALTLRFITIEI